MSDNNNTCTLNSDNLQIPYIAWESDKARTERIIKRLIRVIILLVIAFVGSNAYWVYEWTNLDYEQIETETVDIDNDDNSGINYIKNGGVITNGHESENQTNKSN